MKILLINVCIRPDSPRYIPPVGLGYIATSLKQHGYEFDLLDLDMLRPSEEKLKQLITKKRYDIYLMGSIVTGYKYVKQLARIIRKANSFALIIVGNSVADSIMEADIVVLGEGDEKIIDILKAKPFIGLRPPLDIDSLPFIDWDIFDMGFYIKKSGNLVNQPCPVKDPVCMSIPSARGCPFRCSFCYHVFWGQKYRYRSARSIVSEIRKLKERYGVNYINFWDDLTFLSVDHCEEVVNLLLGLDIYWNATVRGDLLRKKDKGLAEKMKQAGCVGLTYSLESADEGILKAMNKKLDLNRFLEQKYLSLFYFIQFLG